VGSFKNDKRQNKGTETFAADHTYKSYTGYWDQDKMDKEGDLQWRSGGRYQG
jgi:hypothetical protein